MPPERRHEQISPQPPGRIVIGQMRQLMGKHGVLLSSGKLLLKRQRQADRRPQQAKRHRTGEFAGTQHSHAAGNAQSTRQ